MEYLDQERGDAIEAIHRERILYVANSLLASLQLSFIEPLKQIAGGAVFESDFISESDLKAVGGGAAARLGIDAWVKQRLDKFNPTLIVFCRYSGPCPEPIIKWAKAARVPTIFHIDDDLLNVPMELGAAKYALHNHPDRLATIRYLLSNTTLVYCSTEALRRKLFGQTSSPRVVAGSAYCVHEIMAGPATEPPTVVGYMGSDHRHDFQLALRPLIRLLDARPDVLFEMFGSTPIPNELKRFGDRVRKIEPIGDYPSFMQKLASRGWTIGICPLAKTPFNEVKADTKWVEYTACGIAVVASRATIYDRCCSGGCGLLVEDEDEWFSAFEELLDNKAGRLLQVERAQDRLRRDYSPEQLQRQVLAVLARAHELNELQSAPSVSTSSSASHLHLDELRGNEVYGWAWSPSEGTDRLRVELWCDEVYVGHCERRIARPDVDRHLSAAPGPKGFWLPAGCLNALCRLMGGESRLQPTVRFGDKSLSLMSDNRLLRDLASFRTLRSINAAHGWCVADLWWANSRLLKIRTSNKPGPAGEPSATSLRVFQPLAQADGRIGLALVDELPLGAEVSITTVGVRNPLMPILFVGSDRTGEILFSDLIPFPSLLRGGLHEAEAAAVGAQGGSLEDLCRLSDAYLAEAVGWGEEGGPTPAIAEVEVDLSAASGAEPIFDPTVGAWLSAGFGVALGTANAEVRLERDLGDRSFVDHAVGQLARLQPRHRRAGRARLSLPSRAIPTVGAVVSRRLPAGTAGRPGPHIVTDEAFPNRRYLIAFPGGGPATPYPGLEAGLGDLPSLAPLDGPGEPDAAASDHLQPIAIVLQDLAPRAAALKVFPVPKDQPDILPARPGAEPVKTSIIVPVLRPGVDVGMLLGTVSTQATAADSEVVLVLANCHPGQVERLRAVLDEAVPGRGQIVEAAEALNSSEALNRAAAAAGGEVLLFVDGSVVLHDHRTVETLGRLACLAGIGTVGCMQLRSRRAGDGVPVFRSAGYFPARVDFAIAPHLGLSEVDCSDLLPNTVYPVAANSAHCFAVSAAAWRRVGGLSRCLPNAFAEIDLAARLAEAGYTNLCTTRLSVFTDADSNLKRLTDIQALSSLSLWRLLPAFKASTLVRSF